MRAVPAPPPRVFAIEDTAIQVDWSRSGPGPVRVRCGPTEATVEGEGGPGTVVLTGLPADTSLDVSFDGPARVGRRRPMTARTLATPPGDELCRVATISDLHIGEWRFGLRHRIWEPGSPPTPYPVRSTEAAIAEAAEWGAKLLVVKGDVTHRSLPSQWSIAGRLLADAPMAAVVVPGNHDVKRGRIVDPEHALPEGQTPVVRGIAVRDLPGLRVVLVDSTVADRHEGRVEHLQDEAADALADARRDNRAALVAMHHQPQRGVLPAIWPPGVGRAEATRFLDTLGRANPRVLVTSGHTHRNRRHQRGAVTVTTVGSVKDYPGVWAGYVVHEGGLRQVVRRIARPDVIGWTERSGDALCGGYRWWTPGLLRNRCFTLRWR